ncbi:hypothetical protein [Amycolatopsis suaedae]|uniref:Uncharacterized protein n=1 Tax=Amycolatopsis suaedae TaxID=2510978 RepID=A0A4Q7JEE4_9PSEU|nr:hypothetical protein [Amycolatopsis suaedae]RZQ65063.1 hypothetical protein EWH70_03945 [Amycolatopsis suaedae]
MRRTIGRAGGIAIATLVAAALALPGTASADVGVDPMIVDSCDATLKGKNGKPLTIDLGAPVDAPGLLTVGLGSKSKGTNGNSKPLLSLPVKEALDGLGISKNRLVADTAGRLCDTTKSAGNEVSGLTQSVLPTDDIVDTKPPAQERPEPPNKPNDPKPQPTPPSNGPGGINPGGGSGGGSAVSPIQSNLQPLGPLGAVIGPVLPPGAAPPMAPDLGGAPPQVLAENSGTAESLPASSPPERLPLLLAVLALAIVAALLARAWRKKVA